MKKKALFTSGEYGTTWRSVRFAGTSGQRIALLRLKEQIHAAGSGSSATISQELLKINSIAAFV